MSIRNKSTGGWARAPYFMKKVEIHLYLYLSNGQWKNALWDLLRNRVGEELDKANAFLLTWD